MLTNDVLNDFSIISVPYCRGEKNMSTATLIVHPFNFLPGLQSGKEGVGGVIGGGLRTSTFLERFKLVGLINCTCYYDSLEYLSLKMLFALEN
jgi:hypothetical protein